MRRFAVLMVVFSSIIWATGGPVIKIMLNLGLAENEIYFLKALFCLFSILIFNILFRKKINRIKEAKDFFMFAVCGIIGYLFYGMLYGYAVKRVPMSVAVVLVYTAPAIVMLISVLFFREKFTRIKQLCLGLITMGCIFVTGVFRGGMGSLSAAGILLGLASGVCYAIYSITGSMLMKKYDVWTVTTYNFIFAFIAMCLMPGTQGALSRIMMNKTLLLYCLYFSVICGTVSNVIYIKALEYIEASKASMITTIEPVMTSVIGILFFQEEVYFLKILGISLIIISVMMLNQMQKDKMARKEE